MNTPHLVKIADIKGNYWPFVFSLILSTVLPFASHSQGVTTYINPVLPGDHPDQTILRVGNDFYSTGSSFDFTPNVPILHSKDLVHWEIISRAVPANWSGLTNDVPGGGCWEGALAYFNNTYWVYFSTNYQQYFCKATTPYGPWSAPTQVKTTSTTGAIGYDNSIFVDDDGTPYMLIKSSQFVNKIQQVGMDGHLTGTMIDISWINATGQYSWAEGPVMCKRNGWYYYIFAGNVSGGQYTYRTQSLTAPQSSWQFLGNFFSQTIDPAMGLRGPNHVSQPIQIQDGTWWALSHSYNSLNGNDWSGQGRQGLLHQVIWDANGTPNGTAPTTSPLTAPALADGGIPWNLPRNDFFKSTSLGLQWHFIGKVPATKYSLTARPGWMRINPGTGLSDVLQKDAGQFYSLLTRVDFNAQVAGQEAGLRIVNGAGQLCARLFSGYDKGKKIIFNFDTTTNYEVANTVGNVLWLKLERKAHVLTGYFSADRTTWTQVGNSINISNLDKGQPNFNSWVGNSIGMYANNQSADFDAFIYKDGFSVLPTQGFNNQYGIQLSADSIGNSIGYIENGDWIMLGGVHLGDSALNAQGIQIRASSANSGGAIEVWLDNIGSGTKIATIPISGTSGWGAWKMFSANLNATGQHDVYLKFTGGGGYLFNVNSVQFLPNKACTSTITANGKTTFCSGAAVTLTANAGASYLWRNGTAQVGTLSTLKATASGDYSVIVTSATGCTDTSSATNVTVNPLPVISQYININSKGWQTLSSVTVCDSSSVYFGPWPNVATGWTWTGPNGFTSAIRNPLLNPVTSKQAGIYTATYTDLNGCKDTANFTLSVSVPTSSITASATSFCPGSNVMLTANQGTAYQWFNGTAKVGTASTFTATSAGNYTVTVTNTNGCTATSSSTVITVNTPPTVAITSPLNNATISANNVILTATATGGTISNVSFYENGTLIGSDATSPYSYSASNLANGSYVFSAVAKNANNCADTAKVNVTINKIVTGLESQTTMEETVLCYPNPYSSSFTIVAKGDFSYSVCDMAGNEVEKGSGQEIVTVGESLSTGMYLVKVYGGQQGNRFLKVTKRN